MSSASATTCISIRATSTSRPSWSALDEGYRDGILEQRPTLVNLQCDVDHPTQCMADMLHVIHYFGGVENLKGKKVAMTWAYSPSYGKPLSVPAGRYRPVHPLRHGRLRWPIRKATKYSPKSKRSPARTARSTAPSSHKTQRHEGSLQGRRHRLSEVLGSVQGHGRALRAVRHAGDQKGIDELEQRLLAQNAEHKDWACTEEMMSLTKDGKALYLHCLPADITGLSCEEGEVDNSVFDRYLVPLYKQASYKPYIIAAMIFMSKVKDPVNTLMALDAADDKRKKF